MRECALSRWWSVLLLAREEAKRGREWLARPFMLLGEVNRAEWHQSFSLDEIHKFETPTAKTIPALNNDLKFLLQQYQCLLTPTHELDVTLGQFLIGLNREFPFS